VTNREQQKCTATDKLLVRGSRHADTVSSFDAFELHMRTNCIGPIIVAQQLLKTQISIGNIVFMSSDSGSVTKFMGHEDG